MIFKTKTLSLVLFFCFLFTSFMASADTLLIIVNIDNPATSITDLQLKQFFNKTKRAWEHGLKVVPVHQQLFSMERQSFMENVLQTNAEKDLKHGQDLRENKATLPPVEVENASQVIAIVGFDTAAIGYVFSKDLKPGDLKKVKVLRTID